MNNPIERPGNLHPSTETPGAIVNAAKWPPDDADLPDDPPDGGGAPMGGGGGEFDGNFKKGRGGMIAIGLLLFGGLAAFAAMGMQQDEERLSIDEAIPEKAKLLLLPEAEQVPKWKDWAANGKSPYLTQEALKQLAWARDPDGVGLAIQALKDPDASVQAMAALVLGYYGSPMADAAREPLRAMLSEAESATRPQIAYALIELGDKPSFAEIMKVYRTGHLGEVHRIDGIRAFNPQHLVNLVSLDELVGMADDESMAVRSLVATVLSANAAPKFSDVLIKLVQDKEFEVSRKAAPGIGKLGEQRARDALLAKIRATGLEDRRAYLEALRNGSGTRGLVVAFASVDTSTPTKAWQQTQQIMNMIRKQADPSGGDALVDYIATKPNVHWQTEAAFALAEIGDLRGVPTLARRLRMSANKIYSEETLFEKKLKNINTERVVAARMIADLATIHPDQGARIRDEAEDAVIFWIHDTLQPHANGLRALVRMGSEKDRSALRKWANPGAQLPLKGQRPPVPAEWSIAQSAMRYLGMMKDATAAKIFTTALTKRPHGMDATASGLMGSSAEVLGMTLRAMGTGAAHGFAELQDPKAFKSLFKYVQTYKENDQARLHACAALAWVADADKLVVVAEKIDEYSSESREDQSRRACLLETLITRPIEGTAGALIGMLKPESSFDVRHQVARAIGKAGFDDEVKARLFELLKDEALMNDAALALMLGGDSKTAARAVQGLAGAPKEALEELQELWFRTFGYWSTNDLDEGHLFRFVENSKSVSRVELNETPQIWAKALLVKQLDRLQKDNGPHSFTRVVLRSRLMKMANGDDEKLRTGAVRTLEFMRELGVLLSLRDGGGPTAKQAGEAYHALLNPASLQGVKAFEVD
ncbi:MAG: HEAT repeat domain-containing protein [Polyangiaceae bacterium]|nr:HEAT repeat domain-containing protein [Polyangiaceae bacterium]